MSNKYYVFKQLRYGGPFAEEYWTGEMTGAGKAARTNKILGAKSFNTSREAYDAAGEHKILNWWKVGEREASVGTDTIH